MFRSRQIGARGWGGGADDARAARAWTSGGRLDCMITHHLLAEARFAATPNIGGPLVNPVAIILHYTAGASLSSAVAWLTDKRARASAHLVVGKDGTVVQLAPFNRVTWHAGESKLGDLVGMNKYAIGIELDNAGPVVPTAVPGEYRSPITGGIYRSPDVFNGPHKHGGAWRHWVKYPPVQIIRVKALVAELRRAYPSIKDVVGHDDVSPGRKWDPGPGWPG